MEFPWGVAAVIGVIVGVLTMVFGFRKKEQKPFVFDSIDGTPKQDWTRTGNIDFAIAHPSHSADRRSGGRGESGADGGERAAAVEAAGCDNGAEIGVGFGAPA